MSWPEPPAAGPLGDGRFADARERPESVDALRDAVRRHVAEGLAIYPQGGKTALDRGGSPARPGAILDTSSLDHVIDYPYADMTITVEAGMTLATLSAILASQGQRLPLDAPTPEKATLGGIFSTATTGPRRLGHGRPRDLILGVGFVGGEAKLIRGGGRVVKNVAGYDLPKLLTGSWGTLGVIVDMTLKVRPAPEASAIVVFAFDDADEVARTLDRLNTSTTRPVSLDVHNGKGARLVDDSLDAPWSLWVGFEENAAAVGWQIRAVEGEVGRSPSRHYEGVDCGPIWSGLTAFQAAEVGRVTASGSTRLSRSMGLAAELDRRGWAVQVHAGSGVVWAHGLAGDDPEAAAVEVGTLRSMAVASGGNFKVLRAPAAWKPMLKAWGEPRADWPIAAEIKRALDPAGVMNPGRLTGIL